MKIKGLTWDQIQSAANEAGHFKLDNKRDRGNYHFFVLRMATGTPPTCGNRCEPSGQGHEDGYRCTRPRGHEGDHWARIPNGQIAYRWDSWNGMNNPDLRYRKRSFGRMAYGKGPEYGTAVCFHGFRAFMRACFARNPHAIIRTAKAAYLGSEDFEAKWPAVGNANVGSQFCPIAYNEMCDC